MPITAKWDNPEKTILLSVFNSPWTWQEFFDSLASIESEHLAMPHPIIWVHDHRDTHWVPLDGFAQSQRIISQLYPNTFPTIIIVGATRPIKALGELLTRFVALPKGINAVFIPTLEEGREKALQMLIQH